MRMMMGDGPQRQRKILKYSYNKYGGHRKINTSDIICTYTNISYIL